MDLKAIVRHAAAVLLLGVAVGAPFGTAQAGRFRPDPVDPILEHDPNPTPSAPEPTALVVFGVGVGIVAWQVRRSRRSE
jgi:hypothetical protein